MRLHPNSNRTPPPFASSQSVRISKLCTTRDQTKRGVFKPKTCLKQCLNSDTTKILSRKFARIGSRQRLSLALLKKWKFSGIELNLEFRSSIFLRWYLTRADAGGVTHGIFDVVALLTNEFKSKTRGQSIASIYTKAIGGEQRSRSTVKSRLSLPRKVAWHLRLLH